LGTNQGYGYKLWEWAANSAAAGPSPAPTITPTERPTERPTLTPTDRPSATPTPTPTQQPTRRPTAAPTAAPTQVPTTVRGAGLSNGWVAYGHGYEAPSTTLYGDLCVVSGLIKRSAMASRLMALPPDCRPNKRVIFNLNNHANTLRVDVLTNGEVHYVAGTWQYGWLNLDGISFAVRNQRAVGTQNGFAAYGGSYGSPSYTVSGALCVVEGLVKGSQWGRSMVQLPSNCRPKKRLIFNQNNNAKTCRVDVQVDGEVTWHAGGRDYGWVSLSGIFFSTKVGKALSLYNGWANYGGVYGSVTVEIAGSLCLVSGLARGTAWGKYMVVLPSECRPAGRLIFNVNNYATTARVDVLTNGQVVWVGGGQAHGWISLSGITTHRNPKPRTTKYTAVAGGGGGSAISSYCPDGFYIDYWKVRTGSLVDRVQGRCSDGSWLQVCGGTGGSETHGVPRWGHQRMYVRTGSVVDQFNGRGGNGGGGSWLDCGAGYKITGYQLRCGSLVDRVRFQCKDV